MNNILGESVLEYLVIAVFLAIAAVSVLYGLYVSGRRRKELAEWALGNDLTFSAAKDSSFDSRYPNFGCLHRGDSRYACNIMTGAIAGRIFLGCDYHYATGTGNSKRHYNFSLIIVKSPILLEPLIVRRENLLDKFADLVGFSDIDFESAEFSRKFYVKSPNKKWAYDIIHPRMMEYLMSSPDFSMQFDLLYVIVYRDRLFTIAEFNSVVGFINGVFERFPGYVVQENKLRPK